MAKAVLSDCDKMVRRALFEYGCQTSHQLHTYSNRVFNEDYSIEEIDTLVITGNTVMLYLLVNKNPKSLSCAPFQADWLAGEWINANDLELSCPNAKIYLPCCISAFVGADITMALLHTNICRDRKKRLLVDIGTNGEVVLWTGEKLLCCSTAAGPAFEGTGLTMGMNASTGAISKVSLENGTFQVQVIGNQQHRRE